MAHAGICLVLMFGGLLIYFLLSILSRNVFNVVAVMTAGVIYGFLMSRSASIEQWDTIGKIFYLPFWRGIADMFVGTIICQFSKPKRIIGNLLEITSGIGVLVLLRLNGGYDYLALVFIAVLTWSVSADRPILSLLGNYKIVNLFSKYQYGMYINHICVIAVFKQIAFIQNINHWGKLLVLLACVFVLSIVGQYMTHGINRRGPSDGRRKSEYHYSCVQG